MTGDEAVEVLRQFVVRAVHIETHSLASDRERLERLAEGAWHVTLSLDQTATVERELPDEERMESLASRVRPLTLDREPIHHRHVMEAIEVVLSADSPSALAAHQFELDELRDGWHENGLDVTSLIRYVVSSVDLASGDPAVEATDVQLAAGWFYADVAHSNPTGWKRDALLFPRAVRFQAAIPRWSMLAVTALRTLDLVRQLQGDGVLELPEKVFALDLATVREAAEETIVMVAPIGTPMPGLAGSAPGEEWVRLNVGSAARLFPGNRVVVVFSRDGQEILERPGAVLERSSPDEDPFQMKVLVDEAIVFRIEVHSGDVGKPVKGTIEKVWKTNQALSDGWRLLEFMRGSDSLVYRLEGGAAFLSYALYPDTAAPSRSIAADYVSDVAAIESLLHIRLPLVDVIPKPDSRLAVRVQRLAMDGELVPGPYGPVELPSSGGKPQAIPLIMPPLTVGDVTVPSRTLLMWHPQAQVEELSELDAYRVTPPTGEPFVVWDPEARSMSADSDFTPTVLLEAKPARTRPATSDDSSHAPTP